METFEKLKQKVASGSLIVIFFLLWELLCIGLNISEIVLPRPSQAMEVLILRFPELFPHVVQTLMTTLVGFSLGVVVAVLIGSLVGSSRIAYDTVYPLLVGFSSIPKVAVVPIFVLWFGSGTLPAVLTSFVICIFPIIVNVATGLATTEPELEDVLKALGAKRREILWNVGLPRAMPYFFASLKVAITLAFVGTVLAETIASNQGIGNVMMIATSSFDVPLVFANLFLLAFLGIILYVIFSVIERRVTGWAMRKSDLSTA